MSERKITVTSIAQGAIIAALYVVLCIVFQPISFGAVQFRIAEALTILPLFTPAAVPGLFIGCLLGNLLTGAIIWDVIFGSIATLIGAIFGYMLRSNRWLVPFPAVLANTVIVPFILKYGYGDPTPMPLMFLYLFIGEILGCYILGEILAYILMPYRKVIFREKA